ncbi:MAG TPA: hypothetical protein VH817_11175 [Thermoleophilaceae bacterium]
MSHAVVRPSRRMRVRLLIGVAASLIALQCAPAIARAEWQSGVNFRDYTPASYGAPAADTSLARVAADKNTHVAIVTTWYTPNLTSSTIAPDPNRTPSDAAVLHAMAQARADGLQAVLKPHVDSNTGDWRGYITASDPDAWFASYTRMIDHYADLATQGGASMLVIGTELKGMSGSANTARWQGLIADVRHRFAGKLVYAANYNEFQGVKFWNRLDYIGVDAYFPLASASDPSLADLLTAWTSRGYVNSLHTIATNYNRKVLFTEVGYRSEPDTATHPFQWSGAPAIDLLAQSTAYEAAYETFAGQPWFAGMYWWYWPPVLPADGGMDPEYRPIDKPAETVMQTWNALMNP